MKLYIICLLFIFILAGCLPSHTHIIVQKEPQSSKVVQNVERKAKVNTPKIKNTVKPNPEYFITNNWMIKPISNARKNIVLLTIDDAPDRHALQMALTLKQLNAHAIFFVNGIFLKTADQKQILKKISDMGFLIGNHTFDHRNLTTLTFKEQYQEIIPLNAEIQTITGKKPVFFRAPFGENSDYSRMLAAKQDMVLMNWTYGYDWVSKYQNSLELTKIMVNSPYLHNGSILLMHDRDWTNKALKGIVEGLRAKGYEIVDPTLIKVPVN